MKLQWGQSIGLIIAIAIFWGLFNLFSGNNKPAQPVNTVASIIPTVSEETFIRSTFVDSCVAEGGNSSYCSCAWQEVRRRYSLEQLEILEKELVNNNRYPADFAEIINACLYLQ